MKDWFMNIDEVQLITFSPTCTSKQVGEAIVHGTGISSVSKVDLTLEAAGKREVPSHALAVITGPVYGGHVAPLALERMKELHADGAPAVVVVCTATGPMRRLWWNWMLLSRSWASR